MKAIFYDKTGNPVVYTDDGTTLFLFSGEPIAYFYQDTVYSFSGHQLGWFWDGWIRDTNGYCALFSNFSTGGITKPICKTLPIKNHQMIPSIKKTRVVTLPKPVKRNAWSVLSGLRLFYQ